MLVVVRSRAREDRNQRHPGLVLNPSVPRAGDASRRGPALTESGMEFAPPPQTGSRIQELGDRLIVRFWPQRSWGALVFFSVWLTFWTIAGIAVFAELARADWGGRAFMLVWLCMWGFGEGAVIVAIAWQLVGQELLLVAPQQLEERKEIGRFARTKAYDLALVEDIRAARTPTDEGERRDFCLQVLFEGKRLRIGEGMGEREAEYVASVVLDRIRPRARWSDEARAAPSVELQAPTPSRRSAAVIAAIVFPAMVIVALVWLGPHSRQPRPQGVRTTTSAGARPTGPPSTQQFSDPREYAAAMTLYSLTSAQARVLGRPDCGSFVTWRAWVCTVSAKSLTGPFAGRRLIYRCYPQPMPQPGGRPTVEGILCGPERPPPITGTAGS